jgi:hypothetical protein
MRLRDKLIGFITFSIFVCTFIPRPIHL